MALLVACRGNELPKGLAPYHYSIEPAGIDGPGHRNEKVFEYFNVTHLHHLLLYALKLGLGLDELWRQVEFVVGTGCDPTLERNEFLTDGYSPFTPGA